MAQNAPEPQVRDADIDGLSRGSWLPGFARGVALGGLGSVVALLGLTLTQPLPPHLPGVGTVTVLTPGAGEGAETEPSGTVETPAAAADTDTASGNTATAPVSEAEPTEVPAASTTAESGTTGTASKDPEPAAPAGAEATDDAAQVAAVSPTETEAAGAETTGAGSETETPAADTPATETPAAEDAPAEETNTATPEPAQTETNVEVAALAPARVIELAGPALKVNARVFDAPPNAPLMAVVLEDPARGAIAANAMALLTMPLTFAVRPDRAGAQDLADAARAAGHEILAQLPLSAPKDGEQPTSLFAGAASPQGLSTVTQNYLADLGSAIGATVPSDAPVLNDQSAMEAILAPLAPHGFAYLDLKSGIGSTGRRISESSGFEYAESNRYAGPEATEEQIYQILDGAAFQARRKGTAIVSVAASSAALKAVVRWGLERGGQEVWFAPLSAVIARQKAG